MSQKNNRMPLIVGIALFALAALITISLISGSLNFGAASPGRGSLLFACGTMLFSVYGISSYLIPLYLLACGAASIDSRWSRQRIACLAVSIIPFFTIALAEHHGRVIATQDASPIAITKICILAAIAVLLVAMEYLVTMLLASASLKDEILPKLHGYKDLAAAKILQLKKSSSEALAAAQQKLQEKLRVEEEERAVDDAGEDEAQQQSAQTIVSGAADEELQLSPEEAELAQSLDKDIDSVADSLFAENVASEGDEDEMLMEDAVTDEELSIIEQTVAEEDSALNGDEPQPEARSADSTISYEAAAAYADNGSPAAPAPGAHTISLEDEAEPPQYAARIPQEEDATPAAATEARSVSPEDEAEPVLHAADCNPIAADAADADYSSAPAYRADADSFAADCNPIAADATPAAATEARSVSPEDEAEPVLHAADCNPIAADAADADYSSAPAYRADADSFAADCNPIAADATPAAAAEARSVSPEDEAEPVLHADSAAGDEPRQEPPALPEAEHSVIISSLSDVFARMEADAGAQLDNSDTAPNTAAESSGASAADTSGWQHPSEIPSESIPSESIPEAEASAAAESAYGYNDEPIPVEIDEDESTSYEGAQFDPVAAPVVDSEGKLRPQQIERNLTTQEDYGTDSYTPFPEEDLEIDESDYVEEEELSYAEEESDDVRPVALPHAVRADGSPVPPPAHRRIAHGPYEIPTELLTQYEDDQYWIIDEETEQAAESLKETLREFGIQAEVTDIRKGPVVTMFEILPAPGVKLSKIVSLQDNIALRLAASSVRIVAPIPGKKAVGIEIPNKKRAIVSFRECIEQDIPEWKKMAVPVILGKDIEGETQIMDLVKTPHLLIAGSTGSGKSVCVNSMILSVLFKRSPNEVKMILIDPKIVELKLYNDIPHLLTPVITEPKRAMQALQYCLCEMERRYALLDSMGVRDISTYNKRIVERHIATEKLPYIIVVIDEFADLMATTGKQLESVLARLAAMSRAVGIHLVLATQRPSIDVITGLIKANIPSRIAFMVASKTDSRIILDQPGADKLLGKGDMLYASSTDPFPVRIQGAFVSDQEVEDVVDAVKQWGEPEYIDDEIFVDDEDDEENDDLVLSADGEDPMYEKALDIVVQAGKASASYIQRRLKIGYNRAARLVEEMEERGIVGPANGSKPREIIHMP